MAPHLPPLHPIFPPIPVPTPSLPPSLLIIQVFVYGYLEDGSAKVAVKTMLILIELYRRRVWNDPRTVNVIADACFSDTPKVTVNIQLHV